jgi:hypothetical protein
MLTVDLVRRLTGEVPPLPQVTLDYMADYRLRTGEEPPEWGQGKKDGVQHSICRAETLYQVKRLREEVGGGKNNRFSSQWESLQADRQGCMGCLDCFDGWTDDRYEPWHFEDGDTHMAFRVTLARLMAIPLIKKGTLCCGCGGEMDIFGDHALNCGKGSGGTLGSWKINRHNECVGIIYKLGVGAGMEIAKEVQEAMSNARPSDLLVRNDAGGLETRHSGKHSLDQNFSSTSYDVTVTATQKTSNGTFGACSAAGGAGSAADAAYKAKVRKYKRVFDGVATGTNRRRRFEPLVFESSGLAHRGVQRLARDWESAASERQGTRGRKRLGLCTRRKLSSAVHYWNAVSIIRRAGGGLLVRKTLTHSGFAGASAAGSLSVIGIEGQ